MLMCATALFAGEHTGRRAPGFALPDSKMAVYDLADYRGKVVILNFMATNCPLCVQFTEVLNKAKQAYGDKIAILAVANAKTDNTDTVGRYLVAHNVKYPVLFDEGQMAYSYFLKFTFDNPSVFIIDGDGMIRNDFAYSAFTRNLFEEKGFFAEIDRVLNAKSSIVPRKQE
jgi:peroxiredoxin